MEGKKLRRLSSGLVFALGACARSAPSAGVSVGAVPEANTASSPDGASTASSAPARPDAPADDAASNVCTLDLPTPVADLESVPPALVLRAVAPSFDPATRRADVTKRADGTRIVHACRGASAPAVWQVGLDGGRAPPPGTLTLAAKQALPDKREVVWISTEYLGPGPCSVDGGDGFMAILTLEGSRLVVLGVTAWRPECRAERKLSRQVVSGQTVYIEDAQFGTGAGRTDWQTVWLLREGELRLAGRYDTADTNYDAAGSGKPGPSYETKVSFANDEILVHGTSTWWTSDGRADRTEEWTEQYGVDGQGKLVKKSGAKGAAKRPDVRSMGK